MADFSETVTTETATEYTCPVYIKRTSIGYYGKITSHDGVQGKMKIVSDVAGAQVITVSYYPNTVFPSVAECESSDATEFDNKYAEVEAIIAAL